jgi:hypothetical protein
MRRWIEGYYGLTPAFALLDWWFAQNVRAAGLEGFPGLRLGYYALCLGCFVAAHYRPAWSAAIGIGESSANLTLLVLSVFLSYWALVDSVSETGAGANPFTPEFATNLAIATSVWLVSYYAGGGGRLR